MIEALVSKADVAYPIALPNVRIASDMMGAARGAMQFPLDCYDYPGESKQLATICTDLYITVVEKMESLLPRFEGGYAARDYDLWAPEKIAVTQEDYSALLSPRFNQDFILPHHNRIARRYEYSLVHLHPSSIHVLDQFLDMPELTAVELNYEPGGPDLDTMIPVWRRIQRKKPLVIALYGLCGPDGTVGLGPLEEKELSRLVAELDPRGLALFIIASNAEHARKLTEIVERTTSRRAHLG